MPAHATVEPHLYIHQPTALFKARVNMASVTYPVTAITFDGVTLGAFGDIEHDMTLLLGSADGLDDYGRTRVQKVATSTTIPVARVSRGVEDGTLEIVDNAYITIYEDDFRVWAKLPYQSPDGIDYKDGDVPVGTFLVDIPPVAIMGAGFAGYTSAGIITVSFDASLSYAMSDGATITTYAWDVKDGTITVGTSASAAITATFPAGFRQIALTVTDSNGVTNTGRRPILAVNAAADVTIQKFAIRSHRLTQQGTTIEFDIFQDLPRSTYPDGALIMYWWGAPSSPSDRSQMKFIGWEQNSDGNVRAQKQGFTRETTLHAVDVAGRLDSLPGFPQALQREDEDDVDEMWSLMPDLDINKALHYLIFWHSTALGVADFFLPADGDEYPSMRLDSTGSTLYDQINGRALSMTPDHILMCNNRGQLSVLPDWMVVDVGDRPTTAHILVEDDYSDLQISYQRPPKVHVLRNSAVVTSTDWVMLGGEKTLPLAFSIAPGEAFGQGTSEATEAEGLTQSQEQLNVVTGHRYARLNARFGPARVSLLDPDDIWEFEPALMQRIQLNIAATYAAQRGLPFTTVQTMVNSLTINYRNTKQGLAIEAQATLELETSGPPAVTHVPEVEGVPDDYETPPIPPPTLPPGSGLVEGVELVAGIGLDGWRYRTFDFQTPSGSGGPTWERSDLGIAATIYSWVVDPFSPGYIDGSGSIDGWVVNDIGIYRVEDLFGSTTATLVHTFATATSGASFHWRSIQASFGAYFGPGANPWLVVASYYASTSGHEGTWATYSTDGGVTWADEVQISADYDDAAQTRFMPVGLWTSPRTPGLAYTVAHVSTPGGPLPRFGTITDGGSFADQGLRASFTGIHIKTAPPTTVDSLWVFVCPPANTERLEISGTWTVILEREGASGGSQSGNIDVDDHSNTTKSDNLVFTAPPFNDMTMQNFTITATLTTGTIWPANRDSVLITPPTTIIDGMNVNATNGASATGASGVVTRTVIISLSVTEIELDDATIYSPSGVETKLFKTTDWGATWVEVDGFIEPGMGSAGSIHVPWPMNADEQLAYFGHYDNTTLDAFRLKKSDAGVISDVSPVDSGISYGVQYGSFGVRSYDSDRQFMAVGGYGNETSADPADDMVGLWVSSNAGAAWANILAPAAASNVAYGLQIAFGGDDSDILFAWGGLTAGTLAAIYYSDDFGATLDSREGNLAALGLTALIGIAGGVS